MKIGGASKVKTWVGILSVLGLATAIFVWQVRFTHLGKASVDRSLMTDIPCAAPCWQGIVPGITDSSQALEILKDSSYVKRSSVRAGSKDGSGRMVWLSNVSGIYSENQITWEDDIVQDIGLQIAYELTLSEIINKFGPPEILVATWSTDNDQYFFGVSLFYPEIAMTVSGYVDFESPQIEPTTPIYHVSFYAPQSVEERYAYIHRYQVPVEAKQSMAHLKTIMRPWQGYGDLFEVYYESPHELEIGP